MSKDFNPHAGRDIYKTIEAFRQLYDAGAYLILCSRSKSPIETVKDANGNIMRPSWPALEQHVRTGGYVGYYAPSRQGLLILDFDPLNETYLSYLEDILGPCFSKWNSSGKYKEAKDNKPAGYGGHAVWRIRPQDGTYQRNFSYAHGEISLGEVFSSDDGFYFIAYNPIALVDCMDAGEENNVLEEYINKIPVAKHRVSSKSKRFTKDWTPDPESRHDSCYLAVSDASRQFADRRDFNQSLEIIKSQFLNSFTELEYKGRNPEEEWDRIEKRGWEFYNNDREKEEIAKRASQGVIPNNTPDIVKNAMHNAKRIETKEAIGVIASKDSNRSRPENVAKNEIKRIANDLQIPDELATSDVQCLLSAAWGMAYNRIKEADLHQFYHDYINKWRNSNKVRMVFGDFPPVMRMIHHTYESLEDLRSAIKQAGGTPMPSSYRCNTSDEIMTAIRATGVTVVWSELDTAITLQHDDVKEWRKPKKCVPPEFTPIMQLQKGIIRSVIATKKKVDKNEKGETVVTFHPKTVMTSEMAPKTFVSKMLGQIGHEIPRIDYTIEYTKGLMAERDAMTQAERDECVRLASNWLLEIPHIKVVDAEKNAPLAQCASKIVYTVFMKRRLQFMGDKVTPYSQRTVPVFGGKRRAGKTTVAKHLFPHDDIFEGRIEKGFAFSSDDNQMKRAVNGNLVVIADELAGLSGAKKSEVKSFITWSDGAYHEKFKNYENMVRSDVLVGTTNQSNEVPSDSALKDRLLFVHLEKADGYSDKQRHDGIVEWMQKHHRQMMIGGLIMAENDEDLNPPDEIEDLRSDVTIDLDSSNNQFFDAIRSLIEDGICSKIEGDDPIISVCLVALQAGLLSYKRDVYSTEIDALGNEIEGERIHSKGDLIRLSDGDDIDDFEWTDNVQEAFKSRSNERNVTGAITQIKEAIKTMCGENSLDKRRPAPRINGKRGGAFRGFNVNESRLKSMWNTNNDE